MIAVIGSSGDRKAEFYRVFARIGADKVKVIEANVRDGFMVAQYVCLRPNTKSQVSGVNVASNVPAQKHRSNWLKTTMSSHGAAGALLRCTKS